MEYIYVYVFYIAYGLDIYTTYTNSGPLPRIPPKKETKLETGGLSRPPRAYRAPAAQAGRAHPRPGPAKTKKPSPYNGLQKLGTWRQAVVCSVSLFLVSCDWKTVMFQLSGFRYVAPKSLQGLSGSGFRICLRPVSCPPQLGTPLFGEVGYMTSLYSLWHDRHQVALSPLDLGQESYRVPWEVSDT